MHSTLVDQALGIELPAVGMGTVCRKSCVGIDQAVMTFFSLGGRHIDTAPSYGRGTVLRQIADALQAARIDRRQLWLTSKVPVDAMGYNKTLDTIHSTLNNYY